VFGIEFHGRSLDPCRGNVSPFSDMSAGSGPPAVRRKIAASIPPVTPMKRLLFLCTGNYYRSRYAELLFNALAPAARLPWRADSRGLNLAAGAGNVGPISPFAARRLQQRGVAGDAAQRFPLAAQATDFAQADLAIVLKRAEHQPLMLERFPDWAPRIEYWDIHDIDVAPPDTALAGIDTALERLLARLGSEGR